MRVSQQFLDELLPPAHSITFKDLAGEDILTVVLDSPLTAGQTLTIPYRLIASET